MSQNHAVAPQQAREQRTQTLLDTAKPCPFCGSTTLKLGEWCDDDCEIVDAIECTKCLAGAPFTAWQRRVCET